MVNQNTLRACEVKQVILSFFYILGSHQKNAFSSSLRAWAAYSDEPSYKRLMIIYDKVGIFYASPALIKR